MKIIAFAGSNSSSSINHQLISHVVSLTENAEIIRLTEYPLPIYNIDLEERDGFPNALLELNQKLNSAEVIIISVAEHNGNITAFFKNILDWLSRNNRNFLANKKVIVLSTSPGAGGASSALAITQKTLPFFGATVVSTLSIPSFHQNMKDGALVNSEISATLEKMLNGL